MLLPRLPSFLHEIEVKRSCAELGQPGLQLPCLSDFSVSFLTESHLVLIGRAALIREGCEEGFLAPFSVSVSDLSIFKWNSPTALLRSSIVSLEKDQTKCNISKQDSNTLKDLVSQNAAARIGVVSNLC